MSEIMQESAESQRAHNLYI